MHDHHHAPGHGHNAPPIRPRQWQTPHLPHDHHDDHPSAEPDLDLVEAAFAEGFATASDSTSFLRLAGVRRGFRLRRRLACRIELAILHRRRRQIVLSLARGMRFVAECARIGCRGRRRNPEFTLDGRGGSGLGRCPVVLDLAG